MSDERWPLEFPVIPGLDWDDWPADEVSGLFSQLVGLDASGERWFLVHARIAELPFYRRWKLVVFHSALRRAKGGPTPLEDVWALVRDDGPPLLLDGSSAPVHEANRLEKLDLRVDKAPDYIRFFFFAVRAKDEPFVLFEEPPAQLAPELRDAAKDASPLTFDGLDDTNRLMYDTTVVFQGMSFKSRLALAVNGEIEMVDDDPLTEEFPPELTVVPPTLSLGARLTAEIELRRPTDLPAPVPPHGKARRTAKQKSKPAVSARPVIAEMVELLLERALIEQAQNRLLAWFNASLPNVSALQAFGRLLQNSAPLVVVESTIPFVEEVIAAIVNEPRGAADEFHVCRGDVGQDGNGVEVLKNYSLPHTGLAIVLIPLQVYPKVEDVERLAFDITARRLAALVTCERFGDLPECFRRRTDLVLRLPTLDEQSFETLFARVMGFPLPRGWRAGGTQWVRYLLHTDLEHPRRMVLTPAKAFEFVHEQVTQRLRAVEPAPAMSLRELNGLGEARQFAEDLITDIHSAIKGDIEWQHVDRGALLVGAPGTGKTTLARAIAKDCGIKFVHGSATTWMAEGVTLGPHIQAIRRTFSEARRYAPSILFIDEIDSLGSREQFSRDNNNVYQTEVVNAVLEQMQGIDPSAPVFVIGATNHEDHVDPALRRAGRLDRVIRIPLPNSQALQLIYRYYLRALEPEITIGRDVDTTVLAGMSVGLTGADVERIVRGAARRARKADRPLSHADVIAEITDKPISAAGTTRLTPDELDHVAVHEAGHALAMFLGPKKGAEIGFVTVVPRGDGSLGFNAQLPDTRLRRTRHDYEDHIEVLLAGRAAEEVTYGADEVSSGANSDLQKSTAIALWMVTNGLGGTGRLLSDDHVTDSDRQVAEGILAHCYDRVLRNLASNRPKLKVLAQELVEQQELGGVDVRAILRRRAVVEKPAA